MWIGKFVNVVNGETKITGEFKFESEDNAQEWLKKYSEKSIKTHENYPFIFQKD